MDRFVGAVPKSGPLWESHSRAALDIRQDIYIPICMDGPTGRPYRKKELLHVQQLLFFYYLFLILFS